MSVTYKADTRVLDRILDNLPGNREQAIRAILFAIEAEAKNNAPVDTGALQNSIYVVTAEHDGFPSVSGDADRVRLPVAQPGVGHVGPSVEYGLYVEMGTRRMAARPYLLPAIRSVTNNLERSFDRVVTD